jgi:hypothetical protein
MRRNNSKLAVPARAQSSSVAGSLFASTRGRAAKLNKVPGATSHRDQPYDRGFLSQGSSGRPQPCSLIAFVRQADATPDTIREAALAVSPAGAALFVVPAIEPWL